MQRAISLSGFALLLLLVSGPGAVAEEATPAVATKDLKSVITAPDGPLLLDVRTPEEYAKGHIPGALLVPVDELADRLEQLAPYKERGIVTYCQSGRRAERARGILQEAGFQNLRVLEGSIARWREEGREINAAK